MTTSLNPKQYAYVCFTKDDYYVDLLNVFIKSFEAFSEHHLYIYAIDFTPDRLSSIQSKTKKVTVIPYEDKKCLCMFNYKASVLSHFIMNNYAEYACYLDIDCVLTPQCDSIFEHVNLITDCPISAVHPDNVANNTLSVLMNFLNVTYRSCPFIHNDLILFNKNTLPFMMKWATKCIESNHITVWDEYIYNVLLWEFNNHNYIPYSIDVYYDHFYTDVSTRDRTFIYHGCKDKATVEKLFINMNQYYTHPMTIYKSPFQKIRLGRDNDGGYIIADTSEYDLFLSAGIANDISFETDFCKKYNIKCLAYDHSIEKLPIPSDVIQHVKLNISNTITSTSTNLWEFFETGNYSNIFLKMDIEGGEERFFESLSINDLQRIKQIVLEIHSPDSYIPAQLRKTHYLIHVHANNYGGVKIVDGIPIPSVYEVTYLRKDCFPQPPDFNTDFIPTPLDQQNGLYRPDGSYRPEILLHCKPYVHAKIDHPFIQTSYDSYFL